MDTKVYDLLVIAGVFATTVVIFILLLMTPLATQQPFLGLLGTGIGFCSFWVVITLITAGVAYRKSRRPGNRV